MKKTTLLLLLTITLFGCATIIGGNTSTAKSSGSGMGPSTIAHGDTVLQNDKLNALTIVDGSLTLSNFTIADELNVSSNAIIATSKIRGDLIVGGTLTAKDDDFYQKAVIAGNINSNYTYFYKTIEFAGESIVLTDKSKVYEDILCTSNKPVTITIDHSLVKGNIGFTNSKSVVIIQNRGHLKGKVINGTVRDLTDSDNYEGDDDLDIAESTLK